MNYYDTLPQFFGYLLVAALLAATFITIYIRVTPHKELTLIREGNQAVAIQMAGTFLGFSIPLAVVIGHSINLLDVVLWGLISLVTQLATFFIVSRLFGGIEAKLKDNCNSAGIFIGSMSLGIGILQAGCMVP